MFESPVGLNNSNNNNNYSSNNNRTKWLFFYFISLVVSVCLVLHGDEIHFGKDVVKAP